MGVLENLTFEEIKHYLRVEPDFVDDDVEISMYMVLAKDYLMKRCGLTEEEFLQSSTLTIPYLMLVAEFYNNKNVTITTNSKINPILDRFITISTKELL
ncbi:hypothetical protein FORC3_1192 [Clostridium perfringens]|uniref:head-tail connector protein n=1 Tax=Clostridium perfringens TaxID=1502 RepID=UPI000705E35B|nr:head-tail connector protein [Clostridium perfringens]ALG48569.1 hypothetical protein FORC3_1192 [Clostridium perfringens]